MKRPLTSCAVPQVASNSGAAQQAGGDSLPGLLRRPPASDADQLVAVKDRPEPEPPFQMAGTEYPAALLARAALFGRELRAAFLAGERDRLRAEHAFPS